MWPFSKGLTTAQEAEALAFAKELNLICLPCEEYFHDFVKDIWALYTICREDLARGFSGLDLASGFPIQDARQGVNKYRDFLSQTHQQLLALTPASWYPKKVRSAYDNWDLFFKGSIGYLTMVESSLQPPDPLAHEPEIGNSKLNQFVVGCNTVMMYATIQNFRVPRYRPDRYEWEV